MKASIVSLGVFQNSGGPTKTIGAFQSALDAELHCFCSADEIKLHSLAIEGAQPVVSSPVPLLKQMRFATPRATEKAESAFKESDIVSCHSFYRYHALWANRMSRKHGVPYWFVPHGILDPWVLESSQAVKKIFWKFGGQRFIEEAATIVCSSRAEKEKAERNFDLPNVDVVPWPVDLVPINQREERRAEIRKRLGIADGDLVLLYFGRLHHMKRPLETIKALGMSCNSSVHLIVVGNEETISLKDCEAVAQEYGLKNRVHLVGPIYGPAKYDYLHASDAYISLSHRENFNHTAAEALAAGLPAILSPGNDLGLEIEEACCSWTLENNRVDDGASAISTFANCPTAEIRAMGLRGRAWVKQNLSFESFRKKLNEIAARCSQR